MQPIFISGIGTGIGKTLVSAIVCEALGAGYWKPVQAGWENGTDSDLVRALTSSTNVQIHPETYRLKFAASPHIAAAKESREISVDQILQQYSTLKSSGKYLVIEGAGGLMVPLNHSAFVIDLVKLLGARLILVSRNYLGSINHSLLSAALCRQRELDCCGWIFNDQYLDYETEIETWSGIPKIASIPQTGKIDPFFVKQQSETMKKRLMDVL